MGKLLEAVVRHNMAFLVGAVLLAMPLMVWAPFVKTVDNVDYFTVDDNDDVNFYNHLKKVFGNDEFFVIAFEKQTIFTHENLTLLDNITQELESLEAVRDVMSLANVDDIIGQEQYFEIRKFLETNPREPEELKALKEQAVSNPLYVNNVISKDGTTAAIVIFPFDRPEEEDHRKNLIAECEQILEKYKTKDTQFSVAGWTITNFYLSQYLKKDLAVFIPLTYVLITLCVFVFFGSIHFTALALLNISICMGSTMGLFHLSGITLNNVTAIVPPLIMALSLCDTVHIFSHMDKRILKRLGTKETAVLHVLKTVFTPCLMTTVTTAVGFLSLLVSDIPPIREFALMASAGMVLEFIFSFFFMAPLMLLFSSEKIFIPFHNNRWTSRFLVQINQFARKFSLKIIVVGFFTIFLSIWLAAGIKVETNLMEFFKESSPVRTSLSMIEKQISGISTVDISLKGSTPDVFKNPEKLHVIQKIQTFVSRQQGVDVTTSFVDFIKDIHQSFHNEEKAFYVIPDSEALISQYMLIYDSDDIDDFIDMDFSHARISARTHLYSSADQKILIEKIEQYIRKIDHHGLDIRVSGRAVQDVNLIESLVHGQITSLSLAAGIIFLVIFFMLRSVKIGFLGIVPNLFPIIVNFGIMGAFNIPLNTGTALISAVAIGIAVDDTIHFLFGYKAQRDSGRTIPTALERVMDRKGRAILTSSLILCFGFGVMVFSRFVPIIHFSVLSAIIMLVAVIGDLILLPAMLHFYSDKKRSFSVK